MSERVVITGTGVICSAGADLDTFASNVLSGKRFFSPITDPRGAHFTAQLAGLVNDADVRAALSRGQETDRASTPSAGAVDRVVLLALAAAREAVARSGLDPRALGPRMGLVFATCSGPMLTIERHYNRIVNGSPALSEDELFAKRYYAPARMLAHFLGVEGYCTTVATACSASIGAVGVAVDLIRTGMLDAALVGGADAFALSTLAGFDGLKATSSGACSPFSTPAGLTLGEGSGFFVLERLDRAHARGSTILAEVLGYGLSNDAHHPTAPDPTGKGQARAMLAAAADAGIPFEAVKYINAHGTGTDANDKAETKAVRRALGGSADSVPMSSTKSMVGHCLGAAGAVETIAALAGAGAGLLPPTAGFSQPREGCTLDYVPSAGRPWEAAGDGGRVFASNNFAFGGNNASVILEAGGAPTGRRGSTKINENVYITGFGVVSPAGVGVEPLNAVYTANRACRTVVSYAESGEVTVATVPDFDLRSVDRRLDVRSMDRSSILAVAATRLAMTHAALGERASERSQIGFYTHLSAGPSAGESEHLTALLKQDFRIDKVLAFPYIVPNSVSGNVCRTLMLTGHNTTLCGGPGAGLLGLGPAVAALRSGHAGVLISTSVDELSERIVVDNQYAGRCPASGGATLGEGAAALVLETGTHLRARAARPLLRVCSLTAGTDLGHWTTPDRDGVGCAAVVKRALTDAGIVPGQVGALVCAADPRIAAAVEASCPGCQDQHIDVTPSIGIAEASAPVFGLICASERLRQQGIGARPYVLVVSSSSRGVHGAGVFEVVAA